MKIAHTKQTACLPTRSRKPLYLDLARRPEQQVSHKRIALARTVGVCHLYLSMHESKSTAHFPSFYVTTRTLTSHR